MSNRANPKLRAVVKATLAAALTLPLSALAQSATDYAVFGRESVRFDGVSINVNGAPTASNGNVDFTATIGQFHSLRGGGNLSGGLETLGDIIFNGNIATQALESVGGSIHSGGDINFSAGGFASVGGPVVATGNVALGSSATVASPVFAGGSITTSGTGATLAQGAYAQQDVTLIGTAIGPVMAGRDLTLQTFAQITGDAAAGRHATLQSSSDINGNLRAGGNVSVGPFATVTGNVAHAGTLSVAVSGSIGSSTQGPVTVNVPTMTPTAYVPVSLPAASAFTSGGANIAVNSGLDPLRVAPGSYGTLTFNDFGDLELRSGTYYFNAITTSNPGTLLSLNLDLTGGPINIFVTGDVEIDRLQPLTVNGQRTTAENFDKSLASLVTLESHGDIRFEGEFFGTLFAPEGDITILPGISNVTGQLIAQDVISNLPGLAGGLTVDYMPSQRLAVPEPSALLTLPAALALLRRRRLQSSTFSVQRSTFR